MEERQGYKVTPKHLVVISLMELWATRGFVGQRHEAEDLGKPLHWLSHGEEREVK